MKDFKDLKDMMEQKGEVKTSSILEIGYSKYDIKKFIDDGLITRVNRGVYTLACKEKTIEEVNSKKEEKSLVYNAFKCIFTRKFEDAIAIFSSLASQDKMNGYWDFCISYVCFLQNNIEEAYEYLVKCSKKNLGAIISTDAYLISLILKEFVNVDEDVINTFLSNVYKDKLSYKFLSRVMGPIERGEYLVANKKFYYFLDYEKKNRKFRVGNRYLDCALNGVVAKLGLAPKKEDVSDSIIVPEVSEKQVLTNTILLNALEDNDYDKAYELVRTYDIADSREIIIMLISRLREAESKGVSFLTGKTKVVEEKPVEVYESSSLVEEHNDVVNKTEQLLSDNLETLYQEYKSAFDSCDFVSARRCLLHFDMVAKSRLQYRNLSYHFSRIERASVAYLEDPTMYLIKRERFETAKQMFLEKNYDDALRVLDEAGKEVECLLLRASIYVRLHNYDLAANILNNLKGCTEPDYYRNMATILLNNGRYSECLEMCFKYNECRPKKSAYIYMMMADCYEALYKPAKALKVLRIADDINIANGINKDLTDRISMNEKRAEKNRIKRLLLANGNGYDIE